jgi:hypothetical protein
MALPTWSAIVYLSRRPWACLRVAWRWKAGSLAAAWTSSGATGVPMGQFAGPPVLPFAPGTHQDRYQGSSMRWARPGSRPTCVM